MSNSNPGSGGPPLRALAMVLIALAITFAGLGAMSLSGADSDTPENPETPTPAATAAPAPVTTAPPATSAPATTSATTTTGATTTAAGGSGVNRAIPIKVLNNSLVAGLAATKASQLNGLGWTNTSTGNYAAATLATTTVYYESGDEATAEAVAGDIGGTIAPMPAGMNGGGGLVVVVTGN